MLKDHSNQMPILGVFGFFCFVVVCFFGWGSIFLFGAFVVGFFGGGFGCLVLVFF